MPITSIDAGLIKAVGPQTAPRYKNIYRTGHDLTFMVDDIHRSPIY